MTRYSKYFLALWLAGLPSYAFAAVEDAPKPAQPAVSETQSPVIDGLASNYLSGQFARDNGDIGAAIDYLRAAHRSDPKNVSIVHQLQGLLLLQGDVDEAAALASENDADNSAFSGLLLSLQYIKNNKLDDADEVLDKLADDDSPQLWQPLLADWVELGEKKPDKPFSTEDFSADVGRAAPLVNYHLALLNSAAGFNDAAAQNYHDAITDAKNAPERVMRHLIAFYNAHNKPAVLTPIVTAYLDTHPTALEQSPPTPIVTAQDGASEVMFTLGGIMLGSGETTDAAVYLQLALYIKPHADDTLLALGDAYGSFDQYARADSAYQRIPATSPLYSRAQLHIAANEDSLGQLNAALTRLNLLARQQPAAASDALITKGDLLRLHKRYAEAEKAYGEGLRLQPSLKADYWPVLFARGACLERIGKWQEAKEYLQEALKIEPNEPDVLNYLGYGMIEHGEAIPAASAMIAKAVKERPDDPQILDSMGWALYLQGQYAQAAPFAERAVDLLPDDATVNDHLGDVYWRVGRKVEARYQWKRSLNAAPEAGMAGSLERKLKSGLPPLAQVSTSTSPKVASRTSAVATQ